MIALCQEQHLPVPEFDEYSGGFSVTFRYRNPIRGRVMANTRLSLGPKERREQICSLLLSGQELSVKQIHDLLNTTTSLRTTKRAIAELESDGLVN